MSFLNIRTIISGNKYVFNLINRKSKILEVRLLIYKEQLQN